MTAQDKVRHGNPMTGRAAKLVVQVQRAKDKLTGAPTGAPKLRAVGPLCVMGLTVRQAMAKLARDIRRKARHG